MQLKIVLEREIDLFEDYIEEESGWIHIRGRKKSSIEERNVPTGEMDVLQYIEIREGRGMYPRNRPKREMDSG